MMDAKEFEDIRMRYLNGDIHQKVDLFIGTSGLSHEQYRELLQDFPLEEWEQLQEANIQSESSDS